MNINNNKLLLDNHIDTDEFGRIFHLSIDFLKEYAEEYFDMVLLPFGLTLDFFDISEEEKRSFKVFDFFLLDPTYRKTLLKSLRHFFRLEPVYDEHEFCIYVGVKVINRMNFDDLSELILRMHKSKKLILEKPPAFENAQQKDVYMKIQEGRKRKNKESRITFSTMINVVMNYGNYYIPPDEVSRMTLFQLIARYEAITGTDYWEINFRQALAGVDSNKLDLTHWLKTARL